MGRAVLPFLPAGLFIDVTQCELQCTESQQNTQTRLAPHIMLKRRRGNQHKAGIARLPADLGCWLERDT